MEDAEKTITLKPDWAKGYGRKAAIHYQKQEYVEAIENYRLAMKYDPENPTYPEGNVPKDDSVL